MNIARNKQSRQTAWPPRCIRGCRERLSRIHSINSCALWALTLLIFTPSFVMAQVGQTPMQSSDGLANRAVQGIGNLNAGGAGRLYYGVNGADRGLGYRGSYMTLGGYFPALEDDYGGLWAADTRGHLSNYGGFFANIGAVRKQLLNSGSLLGFGIFWDYDGDQNQFTDQIVGEPGFDPITFAGGYSYNQVGVSGELLTDWGNIRSNGYIPVGSTGESTGKYVSTNLLCMQGINAALGGADFELGAYLPGLADWAGMINVGGYTYGNTRYQLDNGNDLVPWFGGVYTRLDMTFAHNWDFSLQYNNDSFFDSTGFARLTYRLGGSRRRNVPDQMEQPMMRNEHIVRAHQKAVVATNPITGQPWRVIHVDNNTASPATGNGSITNPVASLGGPGAPATAETIATEQYDIILVHSSTAPYSNAPSAGTNMFSFQNSNQFLIGEGSAQTVPTLECGDLLITTSVNPSLYPIISPRAGDTGIYIDPTLINETVSGFDIRVSSVGIDGQSVTGTNTLNDLTMNGGVTGIQIGGGANYDMSDDIAFSDQSGTGLLNNGTGEITLTNATFSNISGTAIETNAGTIRATSVAISDTLGDGIIVGNAPNPSSPPPLLPAPLLEMTASTITDSQNSGIILNGDGSILLTSSQVAGSGVNGIHTTTGSSGSINLVDTVVNGSLATGGTSERGIFMEGTTGVTTVNTVVSNALNGIEVTGNTRLEMTGGGIRSITNDGLLLAPNAPAIATDGSAILTTVNISTIGDNGIQTIGQSVGGAVSFIDSSMAAVGQVGILANAVGNPTFGTGASVNVDRSSFSGMGAAGIEVTNTNLRVSNTRFASTGDFGINSINGSTVLVEDSAITGETLTGIQATANNNLSFNGVDTGAFNYLTARDNTIASSTTGIVLQGEITPGGAGSVISGQGIVRGDISQNNISASNQISLVTVGGVAGTAGTAPDVTGGLIQGNGRPQGIEIRSIDLQTLEAVNNGATVTESPAAADSTSSSVDYDPTLNVIRPPL